MTKEEIQQEIERLKKQLRTYECGDVRYLEDKELLKELEKQI